MVGMNCRKNLTTVLIGLVVPLLLVSGMPVTASDDRSNDVQGEVLPEVGSYRVSVFGFEDTLFLSWALGQPDGQDAFIFWKGWISTRLEDTIPSATTTSIWANCGGLGPSHMNIYVSADSSTWTQVNKEKAVSADVFRYDLTSSSGDVGFTKVSKGGSGDHFTS